MQRKFAIIIIFLYFALLIPSKLALNTAEQHKLSIQQQKYPLMFVAKTTDKKEVYIGDWFEIKVIIANLGNDTAYNITVVDSSYNNWTIQLENFRGEYRLDKMDPNATVVMKYRARILASAQENFSLGIVTLEYTDSRGNTHKVISEELIIKVKSKYYYIDKNMVYRGLLLALTIAVVGSIVPLVIIERKVLLEYQQKRK